MALLLPLIIGLLLGAFFASVAVNSSATGLDAGNRGWFFLMVPPMQLVTSVVGTAYVAALYAGLAALPPPAGRSAGAWAGHRPWSGEAPDHRGIPRNVVTAVGIAIGGTLVVFLVVPVQVILTTWLLTRPDLYSDVEKVIIGVETAAVTMWIAYLCRSIWRGRRAAPPSHEAAPMTSDDA
jgi:hypothetical protein